MDAKTSLARALTRDPDGSAEADLIRRKYQERYEPGWQIYARKERPEQKADAVIDNREVLSPGIIRR